MEHIVDSSVNGHIDRNKILTNAQHGFRKKRSCDSQLIVTIHDIASKMERDSIRLSSASNLISDEVAVSGMSLMYARNSRGPSSVPWGTPESTGTIHDRASKMERDSQGDIILLEFAKAFDKVPHHRLLHK
jgi:hypothetical protein